MSDDLMAFLTACVDEDEAAAREAADGDSGSWFMGDRWNIYRTEDEAARDDDHQGEEHQLVVYGNVKPQSGHIARHDPARVLAEVAASRLLLDHYSQVLRTRTRHERAVAEYTAAIEEEERTGTWPLPGAPDTQGRALRREADYLDAMQSVLLALVKAKAAIYSNRPGYRPEWKP